MGLLVDRLGVLVLISVVGCLSEIVKGTIDQKPLNIDVEWVLQGSRFGFQGFFVEYLGLSSSIRKYLPQSSLVQSTFKDTFQDSPISDPDSFFDKELFPKEAYNIHWLISKEQIDTPKGGYDTYSSPYTKKTIPDDCSNLSNYQHDTLYSSQTNLARSYSTAQTANHCCESCYHQPLCIAWSFEPQGVGLSQGCQLKGEIAASSDELVGATSGRMVNRAESSLRPAMPRVKVFHGTMCIHRNESIKSRKRDLNTIYIGRFMLERSRLTNGLTVDEYSVVQCAALMDEIWVPSLWHKNVFENFMRDNNFHSPSVAVIAEAVDTELFDPQQAMSVHSEGAIIPSRLSGSTAHYKSFDPHAIHSHTHVESSSVFGDSNMPIEVEQMAPRKECVFVDSHVTCSEGRFEFLSVFKWERRKGWDVLLDAYWSAFDREDDVVLRIRSYLPSFIRGERNITLTIADYALTTRGVPLDQLASVVWESGPLPSRLSDSLTRADMRDLLGSVDAFVLPTRGEGWGLPIAEAMSMALPVIVTNYSGPAAYCDDSNAYLLSVKSTLDNMSFCQPDSEHLTRLMRQVVRESGAEGNYLAREKGRQARLRMQEISPDSVVTAIVERIKFHVRLRGWDV